MGFHKIVCAKTQDVRQPRLPHQHASNYICAMQWGGQEKPFHIFVTLHHVCCAWQHQIWAATRRLASNMNYTDAPNRPKLVLCVTGALCRYPKWGGTCPTDHGLRFAKRSCRMVHIMCTTHTTQRAAWSCGARKDARSETITPPPPTCIQLHLCHAMGWVGETISHPCRTSLRPFWVAAPDLGCDEMIGVECELHRHSKPPHACAVCHGGAL